jgi:putative heme-binding domain-containing protein
VLKGHWLLPLLLVAGWPPTGCAAAAADPMAHRNELREYALANHGNAAKGVGVLSRLRCRSCHTILGQGESVGPDLDVVGSRLKREEIIQQVLAPSSRVKRKKVLVTFRSGQMKKYLLVAEDQESLMVKDAASGDQLRLLKQELEDHQIIARSAMPDGLVDAITKEDFANLVDFLAGLKKAAGASP